MKSSLWKRLTGRGWLRGIAYLPAITASLILLIEISGCASFSKNAHGEILPTAQLSLSPNGEHLLVSWNDSSDRVQANLIALNNGEVMSSRKINLPAGTYTTAFANNNDELILTTKNGKESSLFRFNLNKGTSELIYKSQFLMRFPLEVDKDNYVFLEGRDPDSRSSQWKRYRDGQKTLLNDKGYGRAAPLSIVGDSLFLLEPWTPPAFRNIYGALPAELNSLIKKDTFWIACADRMPLVCLRSNIFIEPGGSQYVSSIELINGSQTCKSMKYWKDAREKIISRDGSTVAFHAVLVASDGARSIFIAKQSVGNCRIHVINIQGY